MFEIKITFPRLTHLNMSYFKIFLCSGFPDATFFNKQNSGLGTSLINTEKKNNPQNCSPRGRERERGGINNLIKCDILVTYFTWMKSGESKTRCSFPPSPELRCNGDQCLNPQLMSESKGVRGLDKLRGIVSSDKFF